MEHYSGWYGGLASRQCGESSWFCCDSDYSWRGVTDDYGNIVPITSFTNDRGY